MSYYSDEASIHAQMYEDKVEEMETKAHNITIAYNQGFLKWQSKEGEILVSDMGERHIFNTIAMLNGKAGDNDIIATWIEVLKKELNKRQKKV